jgi:DNA-binding LacI/PurR family transcriptional regulator
MLRNQESVARDTAQVVQEALRKLSLPSPGVRRRNRKTPTQPTEPAKAVGFLVFCSDGQHTSPAFTHLLRGVSVGARENNFDLFVSFISNPVELPRQIGERRVGGLLLYGEQPGPELEDHLRELPTVWLMANRFPPRWGDQVMPDNSSIGRIAAEYLHKKGCTSVVCLTSSSMAWGLQVRELAFRQYLDDEGVQVHLIRVPANSARDLFRFDSVAAQALVEQFVHLSPRPQGFFFPEDDYSPTVCSALADAYARFDGSHDIHVTTCNVEMRYLNRLRVAPVTLDVRAESIGRRGIEQLVWRLNHANVQERIRKMVEPILVE